MNSVGAIFSTSIIVVLYAHLGIMIPPKNIFYLHFYHFIITELVSLILVFY